jgi:hypothetical protein
MITVIATTFSCKKDKDGNTNTAKTKTELITMDHGNALHLSAIPPMIGMRMEFSIQII